MGQGWSGGQGRRTARAGGQRGRTAISVAAAELGDGHGDSQQRGAVRAGHPQGPGVLQVAGGAADQDPDHHVDRHRHSPDRPQHLEHGRLAGKQAAVVRRGYRDRGGSRSGRGRRGRGRGRGSLGQVPAERDQVPAGHRLVGPAHPLDVLVHLQAAVLQRHAEPLHDVLALGVRSPHVRTIVHGRLRPASADPEPRIGAGLPPVRPADGPAGGAAGRRVVPSAHGVQP